MNKNNNNLKIFFGGYFHSSWTEGYDKKNKNIYRSVVLKYKSDCSPSELLDTITELDELILCELSEKKLRKVITKEMFGNVYPPGFYLTYKEWLVEIVKILKNDSTK